MVEKKVKVLDPEIGFAENIYWLEVLRGLWITNRHFMVNMGRHILTSFGLKPKEPGAVTFQYPEVKRPISPRWRGRHRLTVKQNGAMRCTSCMMCETICPCDCIHIVPGESPDPNTEKFPEKFFIDALRCCHCGMCVEACPVDAIRMDIHEFDTASYTRDLIYSKEFLMGLDKKRPWEEWAVEPVEEG